MLGRMKPLALVFVFLAASSFPLDGQSKNADDLCSHYADTQLPAEAQQVSIPNKWPGCESYKFYSGIGTARDYAVARKCAWSERLASEAKIQPEDMLDDVVGGSDMLAVLYANGEGVEQNKGLALRFACEAGLPEDALKAIEALPDESHVSGSKFKRCDFAYTTFDMNFCSEYQSEIAAQQRQEKLDNLSNQWPASHKEAFAALQKTAEEYVQAHGSGETYLGGTIRNLRVDGVEERQRDKFLAAVREFEGAHLPKGDEGDYKKADADLNATYKKALEMAAKQNFEDDDGDIRPEGIQKAERAWLKYRDAWVAFAKLHYPQSDSNAWLTLLTRNRYWSLRATLCEVGWTDPSCKRTDKSED